MLRVCILSFSVVGLILCFAVALAGYRGYGNLGVRGVLLYYTSVDRQLLPRFFDLRKLQILKNPELRVHVCPATMTRTQFFRELE